MSQSTYIWLHRVVTDGYPGRASRRKGERAQPQTRQKQGQTKYVHTHFTDYYLDFLVHSDAR